MQWEVEYIDYDRERRSKMIKKMSRFPFSDKEWAVIGFTLIVTIIIVSAWFAQVHGITLLG